MNASDRPVASLSGLIKSRGLDFALLALALVLGVGLNWQAFTADYLAIDEHVSFWIADRSSPSTLLDRSVNYSATPPLSFVLERVSLEIFGAREWALRLPAALAYIGAIVAVWWVGVRWLSPPAGGLAALLVAANPSVLHLAVAGRPYSVGLLIGVLALDATLQLAQRASWWFHWHVWVILNLLLIQTHYLFGALVGAEWLALAWSLRAKRFGVREFFGWSALLFVSSLSALPGFFRVWERREFLNWTTRRPALTDFTGLVLPVELQSFRDPVWWSVVAAAVLWFGVAHRFRISCWTGAEEWRRTRGVLVRLAVHFVIPVGGMWLLAQFWFASLAAERYLVIYVPAGALVVGGLLSLLSGRVAPVLACLSILLLGGLGARLSEAAAIPERFAVGVVRPRYHRVIDRKSFAWREASLVTSGSSPDLILVGSGLTEMSLVPAYLDDAVFHDYVTCRLGRMYCSSPAARISLPMFWTPAAVEHYRAAIDRLRSAHVDSAPVIALVCATDTDLLRASGQQAAAFLQAAGLRELNRVQYEDVDVIFYSWSVPNGDP